MIEESKNNEITRITKDWITKGWITTMREIYCVLWTGQNNSIHHWRNSIYQRQDFRLDESPSTERKGSHEDMVTCGLGATIYAFHRTIFPLSNWCPSKHLISLSRSLEFLLYVWKSQQRSYRWKIIGLSSRSISWYTFTKRILWCHRFKSLSLTFFLYSFSLS